MSSSVDETGGSACGATSAQSPAGELCRWLAAAWFYGDFTPDTRCELEQRRCMEAAGWWPIRSEGELLAKIDAFNAANSSEEQRPQSEPKASASCHTRDDLNPLPPDIKEIMEGLNDAKRVCNQIAAVRRAIGPVATQAQMAAHMIAHAVEQIRAALRSLAGERDEASKHCDEIEAGWRKIADQRLAERDEARRERDEQKAAADRLAAGWTNSAAEASVVRQKIEAEAREWKARALLAQHKAPVR